MKLFVIYCFVSSMISFYTAVPIFDKGISKIVPSAGSGSCGTTTTSSTGFVPGVVVAAGASVNSQSSCHCSDGIVGDCSCGSSGCGCGTEFNGAESRNRRSTDCSCQGSCYCSGKITDECDCKGGGSKDCSCQGSCNCSGKITDECDCKGGGSKDCSCQGSCHCSGRISDECDCKSSGVGYIA